MWLSSIVVDGVRNLRNVKTELATGLNILVGENAQGKTSFLEAIGLLSRGRSFRSDRIETVITEGHSRTAIQGWISNQTSTHSLQIELSRCVRRFLIDQTEVRPTDYYGRLPVIVYSTHALRVVHGPMRERRSFIDRSASLLWPAYRQLVQRYARVVTQRNACLQARRPGLAAWDERLVAEGADLRQKRARFIDRLQAELSMGFGPSSERWEVVCGAIDAIDANQQRQQLTRELEVAREKERRVRITLCGPHRDAIRLLIDGREAAEVASSGQARNLLLALTLAVASVYRQEAGVQPIALFDDLDSELDASRAASVCRLLAAAGQAFVTTAHTDWIGPIRDVGHIYRVAGGAISTELPV